MQTLFFVYNDDHAAKISYTPLNTKIITPLNFFAKDLLSLIFQDIKSLVGQQFENAVWIRKS